MTDPFLAAARCEPDLDRIPVWFMRQAGRSLPEYREARVGTTMLEACRIPELVCEITAQPVRRHGVDAAVFYSDIMVPLKAAGIDLDIVPGTGPVVAEPIRSRAQVDALPELGVEDLDFVTEAARLLVAELDVPLLGFCGAPFTLASYLVQGGPSKDHAVAKSFMVSEPETWNALCQRLAQYSEVFLRAQIEGGAAAVQVFDSWAGSLASEDYRNFVKPHVRGLLGSVTDVPRIHFGVGTSELLADMAAAGCEVVGVDHRVPLAEASRRIGGGHAMQGNLDPALLKADWDVIAARVEAVIRSGAHTPGHIFNLGHGVPPDTDPTVLTRIVELVHEEGPTWRRDELERIADND